LVCFISDTDIISVLCKSTYFTPVLLSVNRPCVKSTDKVFSRRSFFLRDADALLTFANTVTALPLAREVLIAAEVKGEFIVNVDAATSPVVVSVTIHSPLLTKVSPVANPDIEKSPLVPVEAVKSL
jgi:hypothetical protein